MLKTNLKDAQCFSGDISYSNFYAVLLKAFERELLSIEKIQPGRCHLGFQMLTPQLLGRRVLRYHLLCSLPHLYRRVGASINHCQVQIWWK
jgi:hypothetical protein